MIQRLSYDILWVLFDLLDRRTLLNVALVNRELNSVATQRLYSHLVIRFALKYPKGRPRMYFGGNFGSADLVPQGDPFRAFIRDPQLRTAVRSVELTVGGTRLTQSVITMSHCFNELSLLGNLQMVDFKELDFGYDRTGINGFIEAISQLESLQRLKMQAEPWSEGFPSLRHVKEIEVVSGDLKTWGEYPFSRKIVKFVAPMRTFPYAGPNFPKNYSSLKELSLGEFWSSLEDLCIALAAAPNLTHLKFKFSTDRRFSNNPQHECRPTGLSKISHLTITLREGHRFMDDNGLYWLVQSIGGQSRLHNLGIFWYNHRPATTRCEKLLQHVFMTHGPTLERLKLPFFRMTKATFHSLARRLPMLSQLWIGATAQMMDWLAGVLCMFPKLERLRLYNLDHGDFQFGFSFLQQACPTLKVVKFCQRFDSFVTIESRFLRHVWKSKWVHDPSLGPTKRITGPAHENPVRWKTSKGGWRLQQESYATDSGSDMDFG